MADETGAGDEFLELVQSVEEGTKSAQIATVERNAEAGEVFEVRFVGFLARRLAGGDESIGAQDVLKIFVQADEGSRRDLALEADDHQVADIAIGVKVVVKVDHLSTGELEVIGNFEEGKIFFGDEFIAQKMFPQVLFECFPEVAARSVDQNERDDICFSRLHQSKGFEGFVHGAEAARKEGDGIGVFDEVELAGEEVFEGEKFTVPPNGFVGFLLKGEFDVEGEAMLAAGAGLRSAHDAFTPASDDHIASLLHEVAELVSGFISGSSRMGAGRTEDRDFFHPLVGGENFVGIADFAHDPLKLFQVP